MNVHTPKMHPRCVVVVQVLTQESYKSFSIPANPHLANRAIRSDLSRGHGEMIKLVF